MNELDLQKIKYLENINSNYIKKHIFSFLDEKQKLNMIFYNKQLQKFLGVSIKEYIKICGKFIIIEKTGKGKELNLYTKELLFEGEYLNGKRNGKGKEFFEKDILKFEGEYKNGKRNGKGKEYNLEGNLKFEGEYLNGKMWNGKGYNKGNLEFEIKDGKGHVKEYDYLEELEFEGEYLNGERNGKGKEYDYESGLKFEGEFLNGKKNGKGKEYYYQHYVRFEGEYLNGKIWNGKGYNKGNFEFEIKDGKGHVKEYDFEFGLLEFEGEYLNGERNGKGKEYDKGRLTFEGEYLNGEKFGKGKEYYIQGMVKFEGEFLYGRKWNGKGYDIKGNFEYEIKNGKGKVKEYDFINLKFEGEYLNGKRRGKGKEYYDNGKLRYEGEYLNGERNGKGKEYGYDGKIIFEGEFLNDKRCNGKLYDENGNVKQELKNELISFSF